jgi:hypothetical protein
VEVERSGTGTVKRLQASVASDFGGGFDVVAVGETNKRRVVLKRIKE